MKIFLQTLLALLLSNVVYASHCSTDYFFEKEELCFSPELQHFTKNCEDEKCQILDLLKKAKALKPERDLKPSIHSQETGTASCEILGGKIVELPGETLGKLCLCVAPDKSGVSCNRLGRREGDSL